ncbi:hypothetical protein K3495_g2447 [Podosphaera aphanis]|nr:hypothetical protein K3495_g2447 [Podosphaera aphanis]
MATNGAYTHQDQQKASTEQISGPTAANPVENNTATTTEGSSGKDLSKDEVGWYFVEQYYTTLSKSPEKLHLFYGKNSQFVSGFEAEISSVSVGRNAIQERIRELNFQDCKVRISNVDSQASYDNIVIQVIGETSDKSAELKKFVQTFVLAQQPSGYFVLNDIFRYISEEVEEEAVQSTAEAETKAPSEEDTGALLEQAPIEEPAPTSLEAEVIQSKSDDLVEPESVKDEPTTNGIPASSISENPVSVAAEEEAPAPAIIEKTVEEKPEDSQKSQDPSPNSVATQSQPSNKSDIPVPQTGPPKPLSWANRAAAAVGSHPKPAVPVVGVKTTAPNQSRANHPAPKTSSVSNSPAVPNEKERENSAHSSGWQTAGESQRKQNRPQTTSAPPEKEGTMGYVRNVFERVDEIELRTVLSSFGNLAYFDINRGKNCAFVEYETAQGYQAAVSANPHQVSGEPIFVEPRRAKANTYGGNGYAGGRGGANQRGRGGFANRGRGSGSRGRAQVNSA